MSAEISLLTKRLPTEAPLVEYNTATKYTTIWGTDNYKTTVKITRFFKTNPDFFIEREAKVWMIFFVIIVEIV